MLIPFKNVDIPDIDYGLIQLNFNVIRNAYKLDGRTLNGTKVAILGSSGMRLKLNKKRGKLF